MKTFSALRKSVNYQSKNASMQSQKSLQVQQISKELDNLHRRKSFSNNQPVISHSKTSLGIQSSWKQISNLIKEEDELDLSYRDPDNIDSNRKKLNDASRMSTSELIPQSLNFMSIGSTTAKKPQQLRKDGAKKEYKSSFKDIGVLQNKMKPLKMISRIEKQTLCRNLKGICDTMLSSEIAAENLNQIQATINTLKGLIKK